MRLLLLIPFISLCAAAPGPSPNPGTMEVPVARQVPLLTRVLAFDRSLEGSSPLVLAIVYQENNRESRLAGVAFEDALASNPKTVHGRTVRTVRVAATSEAAIRSGLRRSGADVAYVAPLQGMSAGAVGRAATQARVLTMTGVRAYVSDGIAVGVGLRNGRPEILINQGAALRVGADLSARLLQLATRVDR